jgi:hypothetical protein
VAIGGPLSEREDVLVDHDVCRFAAAAGLADLGGLPEGGAADELAVADGGVDCDDVADVSEPDSSDERAGEPGQVQGAACSAGGVSGPERSHAPKPRPKRCPSVAVRLLPPTYVTMTPEQEEKAVAALAGLLADIDELRTGKEHRAP